MPMNGNGLAACGTEKALYLSGMDGKVYRINKSKDGWDAVGKLAKPRIHHRLLNVGHTSFIAVGGATMVGNLKSVDAVAFDGAH